MGPVGVGPVVAPQTHRKNTNQTALLEIKEHTLRNVDDNPVADDVGYDMAVVDTQLLSCFQTRTRGKAIVCGEDVDVHAEPCTDACERISPLDDVRKRHCR